jgi:hypothetical protein
MTDRCCACGLRCTEVGTLLRDDLHRSWCLDCAGQALTELVPTVQHRNGCDCAACDVPSRAQRYPIGAFDNGWDEQEETA